MDCLWIAWGLWFLSWTVGKLLNEFEYHHYYPVFVLRASGIATRSVTFSEMYVASMKIIFNQNSGPYSSLKIDYSTRPYHSG